MISISIILFFIVSLILVFHVDSKVIFSSNTGLTPEQQTRKYTQLMETNATTCKYIPEIVVIQDVSSSFQDSALNATKAVRELINYLDIEYNGFARFGIVSFIDKNVQPFGTDYDYCARIELPLNKKWESLSVKNISRALDKRDGRIDTGYDFSECSTEALLRTAISNQIGWSTDTHDKETGRPIVRIAIIITDATSHQPGLHSDSNRVKLPKNNLIDMPQALNSDINALCPSLDYPEPKDVRRALNFRNIIPVVFVSSKTILASNMFQNSNIFKEALNKMLLHNETDIEKFLPNTVYDHYVSYIENDLKITGIVEQFNYTYSGLIQQLQMSMKEITELVCIPPESLNQNDLYGFLGFNSYPAVIGTASASLLIMGVIVSALVRGISLLTCSSIPPLTPSVEDAENVDMAKNRDQFEVVTSGLFT